MTTVTFQVRPEERRALERLAAVGCTTMTRVARAAFALGLPYIKVVEPAAEIQEAARAVLPILDDVPDVDE